MGSAQGGSAAVREQLRAAAQQSGISSRRQRSGEGAAQRDNAAVREQLKAATQQ